MNPSDCRCGTVTQFTVLDEHTLELRTAAVHAALPFDLTRRASMSTRSSSPRAHPASRQAAAATARTTKGVDRPTAIQPST